MQLVYVLDKDGQPLMPTSRCGKVRRLLKANQARVVRKRPFTIQLNYEPKTHEVDESIFELYAELKIKGHPITPNRK